MKVKGKGRLYHNEVNGVVYYSVSDSNKNLDGTYINKIWNVRFKKFEEVPTHESQIDYIGFFSYYKKEKNGKKEIYTTIQITEWQYSAPEYGPLWERYVEDY